MDRDKNYEKKTWIQMSFLCENEILHLKSIDVRCDLKV